jgi:hypothetical protein
MEGFCVGAVDSFPDSAGIYISWRISPSDCAGDEMQDTDGDGLADLCEQSIAEAFQPTLHYSSADDIGGEPRYAARPIGYNPYGIYVVRLMYMPSYYVDGGTAYCNDEPLSTFFDTCGHYGDSEAIVEDVYYDPVTQHWILGATYYSEHYSYDRKCANPDSPYCGPITTLGSYPTLNYASVAGGAPVVYISYLKHAGYGDQSECSYGMSGYEVCNSDSYTILSTGDNVGSDSYRLVDCVYSYNPVYSSNQECYWSGSTFGGWVGASPTTSPYHDRLWEWGF